MAFTRRAMAVELRSFAMIQSAISSPGESCAALPCPKHSEQESILTFSLDLRPSAPIVDAGDPKCNLKLSTTSHVIIEFAPKPLFMIRCLSRVADVLHALRPPHPLRLPPRRLGRPLSRRRGGLRGPRGGRQCDRRGLRGGHRFG